MAPQVFDKHLKNYGRSLGTDWSEKSVRNPAASNVFNAILWLSTLLLIILSVNHFYDHVFIKRLIILNHSNERLWLSSQFSPVMSQRATFRKWTAYWWSRKLTAYETPYEITKISRQKIIRLLMTEPKPRREEDLLRHILRTQQNRRAWEMKSGDWLFVVGPPLFFEPKHNCMRGCVLRQGNCCDP